MRVLPDYNQQAPTNVSYNEYGASGLPFVGEPELFTKKQFLANTVTTARGCFGNFDTAKSDQVCFGRTLNEVLSKAATGEYRILMLREQWVNCEKFGVRIMQYVQWVEYSRRLTSEAVKNLHSQTRVMSGR